jgi:hypothetical protein
MLLSFLAWDLGAPLTLHAIQNELQSALATHTQALEVTPAALSCRWAEHAFPHLCPAQRSPRQDLSRQHAGEQETHAQRVSELQKVCACEFEAALLGGGQF